MQHIKSRKKLFLIPIFFTIIFISTLVNFSPVTAASCMCDCAMFPGSCGAKFNTDVENCYLSAPTQAICMNGGCSGKLSAFNCHWAF